MKKFCVNVLMVLALLVAVCASAAQHTEKTEKQRQKEAMEAAKRILGVTQQDIDDCAVMVDAMQGSSKPEVMSREQKNKMLVRGAVQAMNEGDWKSLQRLYSLKYLQHVPGDTKPINWPGKMLGCRTMKNKYPTLRLEILDIIAEGDKVAVRLKTVVTYKESHKYKTRRLGKVERTEIDILRIEEGMIVEEWCEYDRAFWEAALRKLQYIKPWK
jgi:predicted SnoaL-like aldol condensation-catalyzing enzyme